MLSFRNKYCFFFFLKHIFISAHFQMQFPCLARHIGESLEVNPIQTKQTFYQEMYSLHLLL